MMCFIVEYQVAIDTITVDKSLKMQKYELDNDDWKIIQDLVAVLEVCYSHLLIFKTNVFLQQYKKVTLFFLQDSASIAGIIPAMDRLDNTLNPSTKAAYHPAIIVAMVLASKKINRYYSMTDISSVYCIAMGTLLCFIFILLLTRNASSPSRPEVGVLSAPQLGG